MTVDNRLQFRQLAARELATATQELFASIGKPIGEGSPSAHESEKVLATAIGFTSKKVRGTLSVAMAQSLAADVSPVQDVAEEIAIADWLGEFTNQLLGRLKNKLLCYGVNLCLSTPVVVEGQQLRLISRGNPVIERHLTCLGRPLSIYLNLLVVPDLELHDHMEHSHQEGELILL